MGSHQVDEPADRSRGTEVGTQTVLRLLREQFPRWSGLTVEPVPAPGWDNHTFRLGEELLVRLPSAAEYALAVAKEQRWLPVLAPHLTAPIPAVRGLGAPGAGYPFPWSVYGWLPGLVATREDVGRSVSFAEQLASFLLSLQEVETADGPPPGMHNWYRGAALTTYDAETRQALETVGSEVDVPLVTEIWSAALAARWQGGDVWFHGDLAEGNLLHLDGELAGVIDFGTCGVGDPSCDLAVAWTVLAPPARRAFRQRLAVDEASWARGRGWALWKTLLRLAEAVPADERTAARCREVLGEITTEYAEAQRPG